MFTGEPGRWSRVYMYAGRRRTGTELSTWREKKKRVTHGGKKWGKHKWGKDRDEGSHCSGKDIRPVLKESMSSAQKGKA